MTEWLEPQWVRRGWLATVGALVLGTWLALSGCEADTEPGGRPAGTAEVDGTDATDGDVPVCLRGEPFVADGVVAVRGAEPGDAHRIETLRWEAHEGCERLVVDLVAQDGTVAERAGVVEAEVLRALGVVRVSLRDVPWVDPDATDEAFNGQLAAAAFVARSPEGRWVFVDVHLGGAAEAYVSTLDHPARVVVDLRPGGPAVPQPSPRDARVVVLEPRPGPASYPLTVTGYARTFEANVVLRLAQDGQDVYDDFTTATSWADAWGHYTFTIDDGPTGPVVLHVGEHSARDGTWEGVEIDLELP